MFLPEREQLLVLESLQHGRMDVALAADRRRVAETRRHLCHGTHAGGLCGGGAFESLGLPRQRAARSVPGPGAEILGGEILAGDLAQIFIDVAGIDGTRLLVLVDVLEERLSGKIAAMRPRAAPAAGW